MSGRILVHFEDARKRAGYTQKEMAALIVGENGKPLTYQAIQKYENGDIKQYPRHIVEQYMKICRVSSDYLLGFSDDPGVNADVAACAAYTGLSQQAIEGIKKLDDHIKSSLVYVMTRESKSFSSILHEVGSLLHDELMRRATMSESDAEKLERVEEFQGRDLGDRTLSDLADEAQALEIEEIENDKMIAILKIQKELNNMADRLDGDYYNSVRMNTEKITKELRRAGIL